MSEQFYTALAIGIYVYSFQKWGVKITRTVNNSNRPINIKKESVHFAEGDKRK